MCNYFYWEYKNFIQVQRNAQPYTQYIHVWGCAFALNKSIQGIGLT